MTDIAALLEPEIPRLRRYARALTRDAVRADDLVQSSLMRAMVGETQQRARRLALDILGPDGLENPQDPDWVYFYLRSFSITIAAGTSQIQRNIIGERVLGLPR